MLIRGMFASALLWLGASYPGQASAAQLPCSCYNAYDAYDLAYMQGDGEHTLYNLSTGQVFIFRVSGWNGAPIEFGRDDIVVQQVDVPPDIQQGFAVVHGFYVAAGSTQAQTEIPIDDLQLSTQIPESTTAYDVVSNNNIQAIIGDRINNQTLPAKYNTAAFKSQLVQTVLTYLGLTDAIRADVVVRMRDGSKVTFRWEANTQRTQYVKASGRTPHGQLIPDANSADFQGTWYGNNGDDLDFIYQRLRDMNVPIVHVGGGGTDIRQIKCNWRPNEGGGGTLDCSAEFQ